MTDERREPREEADREYEPPRVEELPETSTAGTAPAGTTNQDNATISDRALKRDFAPVDADDALAAVRDVATRR